MNNSVIYRSRVRFAGLARLNLLSISPLGYRRVSMRPPDAGIPAKPGWLGCHVIKMLILLRLIILLRSWHS